MENAQPEVVKPATEKKTTEKLPYEPPKAVFVPLKLEERLQVISCGKASAVQCLAPLRGQPIP